MPEEKLQTLSLQVINGSELESGRAARCLFTQQGNVGHGPECHWSVQDRQQSIPAQAFTVILHDGTFCLRPQTAQLWLNQAKVTATSDLIQLRQGDEIQIGRLMVRVHLNRGDIPHYDEEMATPETIVTNRDMLTDTLLSTEGAPHYPGMTHRHQLADSVVNGFSADPLQALQSESLITTGDPLSGIAAVRPSAPLSDPASNGGINTPFMDLPPIYASPGDRNDDVSAAEMAQRHLAVTPLLRGLGGSLTMSNSDDADDFLEEAGRTLQAAIKGLLDLQQQRNSLSDKHLRPLEDNPLRLNMDYATALDVMFAEGKSPVHLAAPAAVSESLRNVRHHEEANRAAIVESLRVLLDAFSPQNLLRRFVQYRRSHELRQPLDDAGAWQMYSHYYEELASDRQQGFEMLFNEVYAQVYDRVLRENSGSRKHEQEGVSGLRADVRHINRLRNGEKNQRGDQNPDIQVGSLKEQPSEITVTLLTEPDTNTNAEGESAAVDVQLVYLTDDSKLLAADYDQIASTPLPDVLGKNYIDHQDFNLLPDTIKTLPPVKLDEKTQFIGVVAYFSDDQATEWKQIETVEGTGHHYRLLVHVRQSSIEMKKEDE